MINKLEKGIQKLELQKQSKVEKRKQLDDKISNINMKPKELTSMKNQMEKLERGANELLNDA